jgi:carboxyl-terminal processing protease
MFAAAGVLLASTAFMAYRATDVAAAVDRQSAGRPEACRSPLPSDPPELDLKPTTVTTIAQIYYCIIDNQYSGPVLDDRSLLVPAFAALTQELQRRGLDQPAAGLPALTGNRDDDWTAFSQVYEAIIDKLHDATARQAVAEDTVWGMLASLNDNHVQWQREAIPNTTGLELSAYHGPGHADLATTGPLYITGVAAGSPAADAGIKPGDEILAVNNVPPYVNGVLSEGASTWLVGSAAGTQVKIRTHRPATNTTTTVTFTAATFDVPPPPQVSKVVDGDIAYVSVPFLGPGAANRTFAAIAALRADTSIRAIILDLRHSPGGTPLEVARLAGAFAHDKVISYWCDAKEECTANRTDDSAALLGLPLVALTDRRCASACDTFASAVKDLHLGTLVGTRTAGIVSGAADPYILSDGSALTLPKYHQISSNKAVVDTIGVAPDFFAPRTAADLSAGRDPGLEMAVRQLR